MNLTHEHDFWPSVCPTQCTNDGSLGYNGLKGHYLAVNNVNNLSIHTKCKLEMANYTGEKHNWNSEKYIRLHKDPHAIIESLVEHSYSGIDPHSKVQHLLKGIKTTDLTASR